MKRFSSLLVGILLLGAACTPASETGGVVELRYATPYSPGHPFSRADQRWIAFVEERSNQTLRIRPNWSGALLSSEHSLVELRHGVVDIGLITPIYVKGGAHLLRAQSGFYSGTRTIEQQVELYRCLEAHHPQFARELDGLKILAVQGGSLPGLITRDRPIEALDDLKGMRIRVPSELLNVMRGLGADPVNMPMGEVYPALAKGIIDGVIAPTDTFEALHLAEVAGYYANLAVPRGAYPARAMGIDRWARLSVEHQRVLEESIPVWEAALAEENRSALESGIAFAREQGIVETVISAGDQAAFDQLYDTEADQSAARLSRYGIDGAGVLESARQSIGPDGVLTCVGDAR